MWFRKAFWLITLFISLSTSATHSANTLKIGLIAPSVGPFEPIGKQMQAGAQIAAQHLGFELLIRPDECTPESGMANAQDMITAKVKYVIGFTCLESLNAALPLLRDQGIITITTGVRANFLTDNKAKSEFLLYRLAPREDMEVAALTAALLPRWRDANFALIDDGTVHARNTAEALRFALADAGLKPVFTDTFRPGLENQAALVRRLQKAGANHVFIGGDIEDVLVISKAANGALEIVIGESPSPATTTETNGTILSVALPDYKLQPSAAFASVALQQLRIEPDNYALTTYAALQIASSLGADLPTALKTIQANRFDTALGILSFDAKGDMNTNPFALVELRNGTFKSLGLPAQ